MEIMQSSIRLTADAFLWPTAERNTCYRLARHGREAARGATGAADAAAARRPGNLKPTLGVQRLRPSNTGQANSSKPWRRRWLGGYQSE